MRVAVLTLGTRGDLALFLGLGRSLDQAGFEVTLGTSEFYAAEVRGAGLHWQQIGTGSFGELTSCLRTMGSTNDLVERTRMYYRGWLKPELDSAGGQLQDLAGDADLFISNLKLRLNRGGRPIPGVFVDYDPPLDLDASGRLGVDEPAHARTTLDLVAMNKRLVDPGNRWPSNYQFTGFWHAGDVGTGWRPPAELAQFLAGGAPPVVATLGSMAALDTGEFYDVFRGALKRTGQRGVIVAGWSNPAGLRRGHGEEIHVAKSVPYDWLFPRCSCIVHHGGTGTVTAALRSGRPSILLPQIATQRVYAEILGSHGIGAGAFEPGAVRVDSLADAMTRATTDRDLLERCAEWQRVISAEDGLSTAVDAITRRFASTGSNG